METVTIIIPCRNEVSFIQQVLSSIDKQQYDLNLVEVIIIDGNSTDGTKELLAKEQDHKYSLKILNNPDRIVPPALNIGIKAAIGNYIVRMDAHSEYPENYLPEVVNWHKKLQAANVGTMWTIIPGKESNVARCIAIATAHPFGVGNAYYRIGKSEITEVDTVPFGCFHRSLFDQIGFFDEEMIRNEDDEFNSRILKNGGKIFLLPHLGIKYYARDSFAKIMKMFYQYALYKPLVNKKVKSVITLRQLVPFIFVLYLFGGMLSVFSNSLFLMWLAGLLFYLLTSCFVSLKIISQNEQSFDLGKSKIKYAILLPVTFFLIHLSYGIGYANGLFNLLFRYKKLISNQSNSLSR